MPKLRFSGEKIGRILSRRSRLSRTSTAPSRLVRPRLIDCDHGIEQPVKNLPVWGFEHRPKKVFYRVHVLHDLLVLIYTPKEARSRIFVIGGSVFARQMLAKKKLVVERQACMCNDIIIYDTYF